MIVRDQEVFSTFMWELELEEEYTEEEFEEEFEEESGEESRKGDNG
jgi:hypothetical protein